MLHETLSVGHPPAVPRVVRTACDKVVGQPTMHVLYLLLLFFALQPRYVAPAPTNVSLPDLANSFWMATGLKMPSKEYIEAVQRAKLPVIDSHGRRRDIVLVTLASEFAFQRLFGVFLQSLANITFVRSNGQQDNLARHMVVGRRTIRKSGHGLGRG